MPKNPAKELFTSDDAEESVELDNVFDNSSTPSLEDSAIADILDTEIDPEELARKQASLYLANGTYTWVDGKCNIKISFNNKDRQPDDVAQRRGHNLGRCIINVSGVVVDTKTGRKGRFSFGASPDARAVNGEPDFFSTNYAKLSEFFFKRYERNPVKEGEVVRMLEGCSYSMYITRGRNGNNYLGNLQKLPS